VIATAAASSWRQNRLGEGLEVEIGTKPGPKHKNSSSPCVPRSSCARRARDFCDMTCRRGAN
jgi:hypothetical protein